MIKKLNYFLILSTVLTINTSCSFNKITVDHILDINIFDSYKENLRIVNDLSGINWYDNIKDKIEGLNKEDLNIITISYVPKPNDNLISVILKYPKDKDPLKTINIRNEIVFGIRQHLKDCKQNEKYIIESSDLTRFNMDLIDKKEYATFYDSFHSKIKKDFSLEQFNEFMIKRSELGYSNEKSEYLNKEMIRFIDKPTEYFNQIKIRFIQKGQTNKYQEFVYEIIENKMFLVGYNLM